MHGTSESLRCLLLGFSDGCLKRVMERRWILLSVVSVVFELQSTDQTGSKRLGVQEPLARLGKERAEQLPKLLATLLRLASQQCHNVKVLCSLLSTLNNQSFLGWMN